MGRLFMWILLSPRFRGKPHRVSNKANEAMEGDNVGVPEKIRLVKQAIAEIVWLSGKLA